MSNWDNDQQWWGGCEALEDRGEEGRRSATLIRQEDRRERRRKWKNLINEIIPQSTSIRLHSAGALHTRRQAARQAGGESVYLVHRKAHRVDESLSLSLLLLPRSVLGQTSPPPPLSPLMLAHRYIKVGDDSTGIMSHIAHSFRDVNPTSDVRSALHWLSPAAADYAKRLDLH